MGSGSSCIPGSPSTNETITPVSMSHWRVKATKRQKKKLFIKEGTLLPSDSDDLLELRMHFEDPFLLKQVGHYALHRCKFELLMCWADILEFMSIPEASCEYQVSKALHIYHMYVQENAPVTLPGIEVEAEYRDRIQSAVKGYNERADAGSLEGLPRNLFCTLQHECLVAFYDGVFMAYKTTSGYQSSGQHIRQEANVVKVDDFSYLKALGYGSFGFVVHCVKKSTGKHYAMKIQTKKGLVRMYRDSVERVTLEKDVVATCHHPFIVSMDYAFQTSSLVMMVMDLGTAGTLQDSLEGCHRGEMNFERVRFYAAEIFLALSHIHRLGLIYRDLKPSNVLLNEDGHIQLVDLGGIIDVGGGVIGYHGAEEVMGGLFAPDYNQKLAGRGKLIEASGSYSGNNSSGNPSGKNSISHSNSNGTNKNVAHGFSKGDYNHVVSSRSASVFNQLSHSRNDPESQNKSSGKNSSGKCGTYKMAELHRATSIMGTNGYMAPEMLALTVTRDGTMAKEGGYTYSVDYWSLGCVVFKLLTGRNAFKNEEVVALADIMGVERMDPGLGDTSGISRIEEGDWSASVTANATRISKSAPAVASGDGNDERSYHSNSVNVRSDSASTSKHISSRAYMKHIYSRLDNVKNSLPIECYDFITRLLYLDEKTRLGSGSNGVKDIRNHSFFSGIKWSLLAQKHVTPPFLPSKMIQTHYDENPYDSFAEMISDFDLGPWLQGQLSSNERQMFDTWDWVSPEVIKLEINAAEVFARSDRFLRMNDTVETMSFSRIGQGVLGRVASFIGSLPSQDAASQREFDSHDDAQLANSRASCLSNDGEKVASDKSPVVAQHDEQTHVPASELLKRMQLAEESN